MNVHHEWFRIKSIIVMSDCIQLCFKYQCNYDLHVSLQWEWNFNMYRTHIPLSEKYRILYMYIYILSDHLHFHSMIWNKLVLYFLSTRQKNVELALLGRRNQTRRKRRSAIKGDPRLSKVRENSWFPTSRFLFSSSVNEFKAIERN